MYRKNLLLNVDSYKASHYLQYPPGTQFLSSYIESRGGDFSHLVYFGLQAFIKEYLLQPITAKDINEANEVLTKHGLPFNLEGWTYILEKYNGRLPIQIEALPEGTVLEPRNCLVQIINTDPKCYWLVGYLETAMLRAIWYPTTVASISYNIKLIIQKYLELSADNLDSLEFKLHDFGARGASSYETSILGGMAHLVNFQGTDNVLSLQAIRNYYNYYQMPGFSIPAAEHSTITSWGEENEEQAYKHLLDVFTQDNNVSIVVDSYDLFAAIDNYIGGSLKEQILASKYTVVIRPDSGDPVEIVYQTLVKLMEHFSYSINSKGYKVLPSCIRLLQGDGINLQSINAICERLILAKISIENILFGMGGALLQQLSRDTCKFAMKASAICENEHWHDIYKSPKTDTSKSSKKGRLKVILDENNKLITVPLTYPGENQLQIIFINGELLVDEKWETIRERAKYIH